VLLPGRCECARPTARSRLPPCHGARALSRARFGLAQRQPRLPDGPPAPSFSQAHTCAIPLIGHTCIRCARTFNETDLPMTSTLTRTTDRITPLEPVDLDPNAFPSSNVDQIPELAPQWKKLDLAEILSRPAAFVSVSQSNCLYR